jgi:hypothetical protein
MVVIVKTGRRIHKKKEGNFFTRKLNNARNILSIQQYMWRTIQYGFSVASTKADIESKRNKKRGLPPKFNYSKKTFTEQENDDYDMEWLIVEITSSEEVEEQQYKSAMKFFEEIKNLPIVKKYMKDEGLDKSDSSVEKLYNPKNKKIKEAVKATVENAGDQTITRFLNEVGIVLYIDKKENEQIDL